MTDSEAYKWVAEHMPREVAAALAQFTLINPQLRGIPWWDALDMLMDADRHLDVIEPLVATVMPDWGYVLTSYVTLTLLYASKTFATEYTTEMRVTAVRATITNNGGVVLDSGA